MIYRQTTDPIAGEIEDSLEELITQVPPEKVTHARFSFDTPAGMKSVEIELTQDNFEMILNYLDKVVEYAN